MLGLEPDISAEFKSYLLHKPAVYSGPSSCFISLSFYLSELNVTEAASCSPISILFPFIIVPLSFNWPYGCPVRVCISQPSLQLALALGLSSGQCGVNRSKACHFQVILLRGMVLLSPLALTPSLWQEHSHDGGSWSNHFRPRAGNHVVRMAELPYQPWSAHLWSCGWNRNTLRSFLNLCIWGSLCHKSLDYTLTNTLNFVSCKMRMIPSRAVLRRSMQ